MNGFFRIAVLCAGVAAPVTAGGWHGSVPVDAGIGSTVPEAPVAVSGAPAPEGAIRPGLMEQLQGRWRASADPLDSMQIDGNLRRLLYDGRPVGQERIEILSACGDHPGAGPFLRARDVTHGDVTCYAIETLGATDLVLTHLPRGNLLRYERSE